MRKYDLLEWKELNDDEITNKQQTPLFGMYVLNADYQSDSMIKAEKQNTVTKVHLADDSDSIVAEKLTLDKAKELLEAAQQEIENLQRKIEIANQEKGQIIEAAHHEITKITEEKNTLIEIFTLTKTFDLESLATLK